MRGRDQDTHWNGALRLTEGLDEISTGFHSAVVRDASTARYMIVSLYSESGTMIWVIFEAHTVSMVFMAGQ